MTVSVWKSWLITAALTRPFHVTQPDLDVYRSIRDFAIHVSNVDCHHETEITIQLGTLRRNRIPIFWQTPRSNDARTNVEHAFHDESSHQTCCPQVKARFGLSESTPSVTAFRFCRSKLFRRPSRSISRRPGAIDTTSSEDRIEEMLSNNPRKSLEIAKDIEKHSNLSGSSDRESPTLEKFVREATS
jgi:hypothetical protein